MERLTERVLDSVLCDEDLQKVIHKLAAYEDTGLTPEEIQELQADRDYWKAEALKHCARLGEIKLLMGRKK